MEILSSEDFMALQDKLLSSLEIKDEVKDEWVELDWLDHLSNPEFEGNYMELVFFTFKTQLLAFFQAQSMFQNLSSLVSPLMDQMKGMIGQVGQDSSEQK